MGATRHAAVIGGGIGGLAAAIALRRAGLSVRVHEQADELRPLGAGLSVWPNGVLALRSLELGDLVAGAAHGGGALRRADGSVLAEFDPESITARYGAPLVGLNRGDVQAGLLAGAGEENVALGSRLIDVDEDLLRFDDGSEVRADLVVGADGLRSLVREQLLHDGEPTDSGIVAFRGLSRWQGEVPAGEWWGGTSVAGLLPLDGGLTYWYLAGHGDDQPGQLEPWLGDYAAPLPEIVRATPEGEALRHRLLDRSPAKRWGDGVATLLGDAAHPMLPFLGQGACSALEDAVALGAAVAGASDIQAALRSYEQQRIGRTAALMRRSRQAAKIALAGAGLKGRLRNALVGRVSESMRLRQLDRVIRG